MDSIKNEPPRVYTKDDFPELYEIITRLYNDQKIKEFTRPDLKDRNIGVV